MTETHEQSETEQEQLIAQLHAEIAERDQRLSSFEEMSTPVIQVWEGVLAVPLVGAIDAPRASRIMENLLNGIVRTQAEMVLLDITGVPVVDTAVAHYLLKTTKAASFLGAHCVLVGISRETAMSMVHLGVDLGDVITRSNLQAGIEYALSQLGFIVVPTDAKERDS
jgi:rsbT co-antagonist protein RsbR